MNLTLSAPQHTMTVQTSTTTLVLQREPVSLTFAIAGIAGAKGENGGGSGVSYLQDNEPTNAVDKELLFKPTTQQLMVHDGAWKPVNLDGGYF